MFRKRLIVTICVTIVVLLAITVGPQLPQSAQAQSAVQQLEPDGTTIPYAGQLSDETGQPVDGTYDFAFALYYAKTNGEPLWGETQVGVPARDGNFTVLLGNVLLIPKNVSESQELWLAVEVRSPEARTFTALTPRQQLSVASPDSPTALSCAHTHFDEWWIGSSSSYGLVVDNRTGTGDGIRGYATAAGPNYGGVYGVNFAAGPGVYGRSDGGGPVWPVTAPGEGCMAPGQMALSGKVPPTP